MHLIQAHHIHFSCHEKNIAMTVKEQLPILLRQEFYPKLETLLDRYDVRDQVCEIASLPITIRVHDIKAWKQEIVRKSLDQIALFLEAKSLQFSNTTEEQNSNEDNQITIQSHKSYVQKLLLDYVQTGAIPSNSLHFRLKEIYEEIVIYEEFVKKLKRVCHTDNKTVLRWYLNIPKVLKQEVIAKALVNDLGKERVIITITNIITEALKEKNARLKKRIKKYVEFLFWNYVLQDQKTLNFSEIRTISTIGKEHFEIPHSLFVALVKKYTHIEIKEISFFEKYVVEIAEKVLERQKPSFVDTTVLEKFNALQKDQKAKEESIPATEQFSETEIIESSGSYINNAGLVLLHPFLFTLFDRLGYVEQQQWKSKQLQHKAVLLTQYLVCFDQEVFENELLFNKLLCGVPFEEPIATDWMITEDERKQCRSLLTSVIEHWKILKNTSPEGLQHSFLQREGKLKKLKNGNYQLHVAQTGIDVLLDQLPWGLGMFKTPWMDCFVDCIWN